MSRLQELIGRSQQGDQEAKEELIVENSGLIWAVARRFMGRGVDPDDLYQLGCLGFLKAVDGFDDDYGTQFSTYAVPKITGEIRRFLRDDGAIKVSRSVKERAFLIRSVKNHLSHALGREPTIQEISRQTGLTPEEIAIAESATAAVESIQQESGEDGFSLESILSNSESEEVLMERILLRQGISALPEREKLVIKLRFFHGMTQARVATVLEVSQVQVSRIEKKAVGMLREFMS